MSDQAKLINLEILRMAKELVTNEYVDLRAQLHNKWLKEAEESYIVYGKSVPYPDIPPYPTESDVVNRAQSLLNFLLENNERVSTVAGSEDLSTMAIGTILEPATVAPVGPEDPIVDTCTGPTGVAAAEEACTGPTGVVAEDTCTGPTGAVNDTDTKAAKPKPKGRAPMDPEEYMEYAFLKTKTRGLDDQSDVSKVIPDLMKIMKQTKIV